MKFASCSSYCAVVEDCQVVRHNDGQSVFKVYFCSINGREQSERYEWPKCPLSQSSFLNQLKNSKYQGVGFVTAFPHIGKIFLYPPQNEILQYVEAFKPESFAIAPLQRDNDFLEFACLAEAVIAAREFVFWSESESVEEYLSQIGEFPPLPIRRKDKLRQYWRSC